ncbi:DUF6438 domain-containing protein [Chryseobacterium luquanense]|uniref:DUF6438 domain-containing protein n=1 Tax=Chryseobacterium luquanense TaxID=2983766 RepID=A0ABT3Y817_9FLAO|nr:DUF6438 domain-containing protein [Chryseobacterium luquanense]MCX8534309.1 DUF6438 domain-containing protein [Chryseobacterium luquanense]
MKYLLSLFAIVALFSCQSQKMQSKYSTIEYEAGACFGSCPIFKMTINPDRTAVLEAEHFNFSQGFSKGEFDKPREGTFKTTIKEEDYKKLTALLDGLNVKTLNEKYGTRNITDLPTSYLRIKFSDGTDKNVEDYGKRGTEKLTAAYKFFEDLKHNQKWEKVQ